MPKGQPLPRIWPPPTVPTKKNPFLNSLNLQPPRKRTPTPEEMAIARGKELFEELEKQQEIFCQKIFGRAQLELAEHREKELAKQHAGGWLQHGLATKQQEHQEEAEDREQKMKRLEAAGVWSSEGWRILRELLENKKD